MRHCFILFFFVLVLPTLFFIPARAESSLRIGLDNSYPPFSFVAEEGVITGFDHDIAVALCASMHRSCEWVFASFDTLLEAMREGKLDLLFGVSFTENRARHMDFSDPYFRARSIYIGRIQSESANKVATDLLKVGVRAATVQETYALQTLSNKTQLVSASYDCILKKLRMGEVDCILVNDLAGYTFLKTDIGQDFDVIGSPVPAEKLPSIVRIGVRKHAPELLEAVNKALTDIRFNGEYSRINRNYFPYSLY